MTKGNERIALAKEINAGRETIAPLFAASNEDIMAVTERLSTPVLIGLAGLIEGRLEWDARYHRLNALSEVRRFINAAQSNPSAVAIIALST